MAKQLLVTYEGTIQKILFNRPERRNAINTEIYTGLVSILQAGATNPNVTLTVLSGVGNYYSSGTDLSDSMNMTQDKPDEDGSSSLEKSSVMLQKYVSSFIDYPKPLIAIVNGPAIGISVTTLALCDTVYACDTASFHTPFTSLGMTPEGCSSVTFPAIFGSSLASEIMYMGRKLSAAEALQCGFVSGVYTKEAIDTELWPKIRQWSTLPPESLMYAKRLVRGPQLARLHEANKAECTRLVERWQSDEFANALVKFFGSDGRSKL